jgi:TetR/AcrR family transcriptional repressor of nem operon
MPYSDVTKKDENPRERLLAAAKDLFCTRGYHAVGTQELCETAGVLKGTFYHFFPSKLDLALAALDRFADGARDEFAAAATAKAAPAKRLLRVFDLDREMVEKQKRQTGRVLGCLFGNLALELAASEPLATERIAAIAEMWAEAISPAIRDLIAKKEIPKQPVADAARQVIACLQGAVLMSKVMNDPDFVTKQGRAVVRMLGGS